MLNKHDTYILVPPATMASDECPPDKGPADHILPGDERLDPFGMSA